MSFRIVRADMRRVLRYMAPESVDAIVCDPPYGLAFMGKEWDRYDTHIGKTGLGDRPTEWVSHGDEFAGANPTCATCGGRKRGKKKCACASPDWRIRGAPVTENRAAVGLYQFSLEWAAECLRVLKPGGRLLAFGAPRTAHRIWCAIEDAGFVIEDTVAWMFGSGFPKHRSKLKPAYEPVCVARKGGVSALNIDAARIAGEYESRDRDNEGGASMFGLGRGGGAFVPTAGRWPPNVAMDEIAARALDEMSGERPTPGSYRRNAVGFPSPNPEERNAGRLDVREEVSGFGDSGGASRFMYVAKASRAERETGLDTPKQFLATMGDGIGGREHNPEQASAWVRNPHPTVKPVALMRWLVRLVTEPGDLVLDPFTGSGTTGIACMLEGRRFVGVELDPAYAEIARKRIGAWKRYAVPDEPSAEPCPDTLDLFDTEAA